MIKWIKETWVEIKRQWSKKSSNNEVIDDTTVFFIIAVFLYFVTLFKE